MFSFSTFSYGLSFKGFKVLNKNECLDKFSEIGDFARKDAELLGSCSVSRYQRSSINEEKYKNVTWQDLGNCMKNLFPDRDVIYNYIDKCNSFSLVRTIDSRDYLNCKKKLGQYVQKDRGFVVNQCIEINVASKVVAQKFSSCMKKFSNINADAVLKVDACLSHNLSLLMSCIDSGREYFSEEELLGRCQNFSFRNKIASPSFDSCQERILSKTNGEVSKQQVYESCLSYNSIDIKKCFLNSYQTLGSVDAFMNCSKEKDVKYYLTSSDEFKTCLKNAKSINLSNFRSFYACSKSKEIQERFLNIGELRSCMNKLSIYSSKKYDVMNVCLSRDKLDLISSQRYINCLDSFAQTDIPTGVFEICAQRDIRSLSENNGFLQCVDKGIGSTLFNYYDHEYRDRASRKSNKVDTYKFLFKDCKKWDDENSGTPKTGDYVTLYKNYSIHSNTDFLDPIQKKYIVLGGLSGARVNEKNKEVYFVSDDKGSYDPPRIYVYNYDFDRNGNFVLKENRTIYLSKMEKSRSYNYDGVVQEKEQNVFDRFFSLDPEDLDFDKEGNIYITSEVQGGNSYEYINKFDSKGKWLETVKLPDVYSEKKEFVEHECPVRYKTIQEEQAFPKQRYKYENIFQTNSKTNLDRKIGSDENERVCGKTVITQGLKSNKGFESLAFTPDKENLFIANEGTLYQDKIEGFFKDKEGEIRLTKLSKRDGKYKVESEYLYLLEDEVDNGASAILPLSEDKVLVLERSWDNFKRKITARIYLADLTRAESVYNIDNKDVRRTKRRAQKKLIIDLDDIIEDMGPGTKILDNFEGLSFGPTLPDGSKSLLLISDNNFSLNQRTILLLLKINDEL